MVTSDCLQACYCFQSVQLIDQDRFPLKFPENHQNSKTNPVIGFSASFDHLIETRSIDRVDGKPASLEALPTMKTLGYGREQFP